MVFSGQREIRNFWGFSSLDKDRKENRKAIENIHTTKTWSLIKTTTNNASTSLCTHSKDWRHDYFFLICLFVPPFRLLSSSSSLSTCKKDFKRFGVGSGRESKNKNDHRVGPVPKLHCDESRAIVKRRLCQSKKKKILRIVKLTFVFVLKLPPHECECVVCVWEMWHSDFSPWFVSGRKKKKKTFVRDSNRGVGGVGGGILQFFAKWNELAGRNAVSSPILLIHLAPNDGRMLLLFLACHFCFAFFFFLFAIFLSLF